MTALTLLQWNLAASASVAAGVWALYLGRTTTRTVRSRVERRRLRNQVRELTQNYEAANRDRERLYRKCVNLQAELDLRRCERRPVVLYDQDRRPS